MELLPKRFLQTTVIVLTLFLLAQAGNAQQRGLQVEKDTLNKSVYIHPVIKGEMVSTENEYRSQLRLGDQLARDFSVAKITENGIVRRFKNDGRTNEDWHAWRSKVMAPMDAKVTRVNEADSVNTPGTMNRSVRPGLIFFEKENGLTVIYAHVREILVEKGDRVEAGEVVARVGNNGNSRNPHVHVGAWKGDTPLQIQVDLYAGERDQQKMTESTN